MTKQLIIVGGGHAGSSAAIAAGVLRHQLQQQDAIQITLINTSANLGIRPRYYEYELEQTQVALSAFLSPLNIDIKIDTITQIDLKNQTLKGTTNALYHFDSLVMAAGSQLASPAIPGIKTHCHNIDSYPAACQFREALIAFAQKAQRPCRIAILGAGITGIELACELPLTMNKIAEQYSLPLHAPDIMLFDRHDIVKNLGGDTTNYLQQALETAAVQCVSHATIKSIEANCITVNDETHSVDFIVSTLGLQANLLAVQMDAPQATDGRITVNAYLQHPSHSNCFIAGDMALSKVDKTHYSVMSCQQGRPQGRYAGYNAIAQLLDQPMQMYQQPNYVTCVDLGAWGGLFTTGWERKVSKIKREAKQLKQHINADRIYPPTGTDWTALLEAGQLEFITPAASIKRPNKH